MPLFKKGSRNLETIDTLSSSVKVVYTLITSKATKKSNLNSACYTLFKKRKMKACPFTTVALHKMYINISPVEQTTVNKGEVIIATVLE